MPTPAGLCRRFVQCAAALTLCAGLTTTAGVPRARADGRSLLAGAIANTRGSYLVYNFGDGHPAKRVFQALRIEVNEELDVLERAIPAAIAAIALGGRVVVMSYHSLEDKIVKGFFQAGSKSSAPLGFPVELEEHKAELKTLTKGTEVPTAAEIAENPRAASARLRAVERIKARRAA